MSTIPDHYRPTGDGPTPWDLQKVMQSSGSCFVDARRTDAIEYAFRMKDGKLLEDLRKARHCLDEAIGHLEGLEAKENPPRVQIWPETEQIQIWWECEECAKKRPRGSPYYGKATGVSMESGVCAICMDSGIKLTEWAAPLPKKCEKCRGSKQVPVLGCISLRDCNRCAGTGIEPETFTYAPPLSETVAAP